MPGTQRPVRSSLVDVKPPGPDHTKVKGPAEPVAVRLMPPEHGVEMGVMELISIMPKARCGNKSAQQMVTDINMLERLMGHFFGG
jgi:hypothetical protein